MSSRYGSASSRSNSGTSGGLIGANEDMFLQAFETTPKLEIHQKKMENELAKVIATISNQQAEWDSRLQAIKHFRSLVNSGVADDFHITTLKQLEVPFQNNICDLRSQVVRETCITIAFLSCRLQQKFARMAEVLLPSLIKLIPNSAKIVSTSALVALRFIMQSTHNSRLIPIIKYQLSNSKSKEIHRALCEIIERIVSSWQPTTLERHLNDLQETIKLGICDSDEMARQYARRAFNVFAEHFREPADNLFNSLDQQRQRMLNNLNHGGGSTLSMNGYGSITSGLNTASVGHQNSTNIVSRLKSSMATTTAPNSNGTGKSYIATATSRTPTARSTSAIDVSAQKRAKQRAVYLSSMYTRPRQGVITPKPLNSSNNSTTNSISSQYQSPYTTSSALSFSQRNPMTPNHHHNNVTLRSSPPFATPNASMRTPNHDHRIPSATPNSINASIKASPTVAQQQDLLKQHQEQNAASVEKKDGIALSRAAEYLLSIINDNTYAESQIVALFKHFKSLVEQHPPEKISKLLPELMPPLIAGIDNGYISVRKVSVFAIVAIHSKVGLSQMEPFLTSLTMTQRKLVDVYINKTTSSSTIPATTTTAITKKLESVKLEE